jgi:hypothetical protein
VCKSFNNMQTELMERNTLSMIEQHRQEYGGQPFDTSPIDRWKERQTQIIEYYLVRQGPAALEVKNDLGYLPLQEACVRFTPYRAICILLEKFPRAARFVNGHGTTALLGACSRKLSVQTLRRLIHHGPAVCLIASKRSGSYILPLTCAARSYYRAPDADAVILLENATKAAASCLVECGLKQDRIAMPPTMPEHVRGFLERLTMTDDAIQHATDLVVAQIALPLLTHEMLPDLLMPIAVEDWVKDEDVQLLIAGMISMNMAGRNYFLNDHMNKAKGVRVMESISDISVDCLFLHLRENLYLCSKQA